MSSIIFTVLETTTVITGEIVSQHANKGRENVKKVTIPKHIQRIGYHAFQHCSLLEEVIFEQGSICTEIGAYAFSCCNSLKRINLPNTIVTIDRQAFEYCYSLKEIKLPQTLTEISNSAFYLCESLKQIELPNSITRIGSNAFAYCRSLVYVYLPQSIQHIHDSAFFDCSSLSVITAPQHANIHPDAFENCYIIKQVARQKQIEDNALVQQRFVNHTLHQVCYDPAITINSLTKAIKQINHTNDDYEHVDAFDMNALHILCSNPSVTDEMIRTFVAACPSLRSMQSVKGLTRVKGLTPVIMYVKNKYDSEVRSIIKNKSRLCLDDFLRHKILRQDEIVYMLALDDAMQEELSKLDGKDEETGLYPLLQIAMNKTFNLETLYWLLRPRPNSLTNIHQIDLVQPSTAGSIAKKQRIE